MKFNSTELFKFKHLVKAAIGICKLHLRIQKVKEKELARFTPLFEAYKSSEEYNKISDQSTTEGEDDDNKKDTDPKGFIKYFELVSSEPCGNVLFS